MQRYLQYYEAKTTRYGAPEVVKVAAPGTRDAAELAAILPGVTAVHFVRNTAWGDDVPWEEVRAHD